MSTILVFGREERCAGGKCPIRITTSVFFPSTKTATNGSWRNRGGIDCVNLAHRPTRLRVPLVRTISRNYDRAIVGRAAGATTPARRTVRQQAVTQPELPGQLAFATSRAD